MLQLTVSFHALSTSRRCHLYPSAVWLRRPCIVTGQVSDSSPVCHLSSYNQHCGEQHRNYNHQRRKRCTQPQSLRIRKTNPFDVLGVPRDSSAATVKQKFLQLALRHHPDTSSDSNANSDAFVEIREAFENIKQNFSQNGDGDDNMMSSWLTEEEFDNWFYEETGQRMNATTRREVMHVYRYVRGLVFIPKCCRQLNSNDVDWILPLILEGRGWREQSELPPEFDGRLADLRTPCATQSFIRSNARTHNSISVLSNHTGMGLSGKLPLSSKKRVSLRAKNSRFLCTTTAEGATLKKT